MNHTEAKLEPGSVLDHYRLDAVVGRGGMSTLFRATDLDSGRTVALKAPLAALGQDPILVERFKREEQIGQELDHPGIVKTFADPARSTNYMVLEWVEGVLLRAILTEQKVLTVERATQLTLNLCDALDYMHKRGVVHRDLKPENIMVLPGDQIKLIDFGIAMKEDARRITYVGSSPLLGTPDYIAPEQVKGKRGDQRSDVYALGAMFYEMLAGEPPFTGTNPLAVMNERLLHDPESPRRKNKEITPQLEEVLYRALEREPRHRYATALEMQFDLEHPELVVVEEGSHQTAQWKRLSARQMRLLYAGLVLIPALLAVLLLVLAHRR
jgi:serine/threonine protein kinase